MHFYIIDIVGC